MIKKIAERLFANKFLLTATSVTVIVLFFVVIISSSVNQKEELSPEPITQNATSTEDNPFSEFTNLTEEKVKNATSYRSLIKDRFPIYLAGFKTKSGIETTIAISIHPTEPSLTRLDISGLSYLNKDELDPIKNPNLSAFAESYKHALSLLREAGIEPKQLILSYGEADYVRSTATLWVDKLGLLR